MDCEQPRNQNFYGGGKKGLGDITMMSPWRQPSLLMTKCWDKPQPLAIGFAAILDPKGPPAV